jgi:gliding motility-associated lipoprotein GldD
MKPASKNISRLFLCAILASCVFYLASCIKAQEDEVISPKPRAYYTINFPEKKYKLYETECPFTFETPVYSNVEPSTGKDARPCWLNVKYPLFKAQLYLSYGHLENNLAQYLKDARELAVRHQVKASGLEQQMILRDSAKVYGLMYDIEGNTATALQFYLTDSTQNFLRGSLYFNCPPNIDSLQIVIDYLRKDVLHMIQTFQWKDRAAGIKQ